MIEAAQTELAPSAVPTVRIMKDTKANTVTPEMFNVTHVDEFFSLALVAILSPAEMTRQERPGDVREVVITKEGGEIRAVAIGPWESNEEIAGVALYATLNQFLAFKQGDAMRQMQQAQQRRGPGIMLPGVDLRKMGLQKRR